MYFSSGNFHLLKLFLEIFESAKETKWTCSSSVKLSFIWKTVLLQCQTIMQSDGYRQKENWACIPREGSSLIAQCFLIYCGGIKGEMHPMDLLPPQLQGVLSNQRGLPRKTDLHQTYSPVRSQPLSQGCSPRQLLRMPADREPVCAWMWDWMCSLGMYIVLGFGCSLLLQFYLSFSGCWASALFSSYCYNPSPSTQPNKALGSASQISLHKLD